MTAILTGCRRDGCTSGDGGGVLRRWRWRTAAVSGCQPVSAGRGDTVSSFADFARSFWPGCRKTRWHQRNGYQAVGIVMATPSSGDGRTAGCFSPGVSPGILIVAVVVCCWTSSWASRKHLLTARSAGFPLLIFSLASPVPIRYLAGGTCTTTHGLARRISNALIGIGQINRRA